MTNYISKQSMPVCLFLLFFIINIGIVAATSLSHKTPSKDQSDDHLIVIRNHKLIFDIVKQQKISEDIILLDAPEFGKVFINSVDSMTYVPQTDICEKNDSFSYLLKTVDGYDTINVSIEILCETLTILSGFSPNGDGVNDHFTILGVQNFPNNSILIFNKWGEKVYQQNRYENTWAGEKNHGDSLPEEESLYYYVFDNGEGKSYSGYVKIVDQT
ncbi:MAG: gliding motility-associated-like protein [Paraglaciecola sp.]|jgi:gliding motility-associated-like protein